MTLRTPGGEPGIACDVADDRSRPGRLLGGLQHHRVAGDQRGAQHVDRQRDREVERRQHREDAVGKQHVGVALALDEALKRPDVALVLLHQVGVGRDQVDRLLHLEDRLGAGLAGLEARHRRQLEMALADPGRDRAHLLAALRVWQRRPGGARLARRLDRDGHELRSGVVGAARHGPLGRRVEAAEGLACEVVLAPDQVRERLARICACLRQLGLELLVRLARERAARVGQPGAHGRRLAQPWAPAPSSLAPSGASTTPGFRCPTARGSPRASGCPRTPMTTPFRRSSSTSRTARATPSRSATRTTTRTSRAMDTRASASTCAAPVTRTASCSTSTSRRSRTTR